MARLEVGAHLRPLLDAAILAARIKPVGSLNVTALSQQRHIAGRRALEADARGMAIIGDVYACADMATDVEKSAGLPTTAEGRSAHIVEYTAATDSIRLIKVSSVSSSTMRFGNVDRYIVETAEGRMLLRGSTIIVWE